LQIQDLHKHTYPYKYPVGVRREMKRADDKDSIPVQPLMPIRLNGIAFEALLDSGATHILIPRRVANMLGLKPGDRSQGSSASGRFPQFNTTVDLSVGIGPKCDDIGTVEATVPEDEDIDIPILIGQEPVFERYKVTFERYKHKFHLVPKED
jgi:hypothetical protein